jgi:hypothetical protein
MPQAAFHQSGAYHLDIEEHEMPDSNTRDVFALVWGAQPPQTWPTPVAEQRIQQLLSAAEKLAMMLTM